MSGASVAEPFGPGRAGELACGEEANHLDQESLDPLTDARLGALPVARYVEHADLLGLDPGHHVRRLSQALDHQVDRLPEASTGPERRPIAGALRLPEPDRRVRVADVGPGRSG
jgi:hypothetical protein